MSIGSKWCEAACTMIVASLCAGGCNLAPARIQPADIDPNNAAQEAIAAYDEDGDGLLSAQELTNCPAMLRALGEYDSSQDGKISAEEIASRLESWEATRVGITAATFYLRLDGRPLRGAKVVLEPEPFLGGAVHPATAETNASGLAGPSMAAEHLPEGIRFGLQAGLYKLRISHPSLNIPAKYNEQTEIGLEVPPHFDLYHPPVFELKSK